VFLYIRSTMPQSPSALRVYTSLHDSHSIRLNSVAQIIYAGGFTNLIGLSKFLVTSQWVYTSRSSSCQSWIVFDKSQFHIQAQIAVTVMFIVILLSLHRIMLGYYLKVSHPFFPPHPFQCTSLFLLDSIESEVLTN